MGNFKSVTTRRINRIRKTPGIPVWQRNYDERVIRNGREWNAIRQYIRYNPAADIDPTNQLGMITVRNRRATQHGFAEGKTKPDYEIYDFHDLLAILPDAVVRLPTKLGLDLPPLPGLKQMRPGHSGNDRVPRLPVHHDVNTPSAQARMIRSWAVPHNGSGRASGAKVL